MADRDLRETQRAGDFGDLPLIRGKPVGVHEDDGDCLEAARFRRLQIALDLCEIGRTLDNAIGQHALVHLHNIGVKLLGLDDIPGKDFGPRLVADFQRVAETFRRHQQRLFALALQQRVGGDGRAHLDRADAPGRDRRTRLQPKQVANALHRRVAIGAGILRQQFSRMQGALRITPDDICKSAAAVDPEIPFRRLASRAHASIQRVGEKYIIATKKTQMSDSAGWTKASATPAA